MVNIVRQGIMYDKFILPPFSVLNVMSAEWQRRSRKWKHMGIEAELGRDAKAFTTQKWMVAIGKKDMAKFGDTSIFDPVLCELIYKWFCPIGGTIIDPFAGGSVRGLIAGFLGYDYIGIDLAEDQIAANVKNIGTVSHPPEKLPKWIVGDSAEIHRILPGVQADLIFSCPPYYDLEVYTNKVNDLSNMSWGQFLKMYNEIIRHTVMMLKDNRFASFVVSEIRDERGFYRSLVPETIRAFESAGMRYYNEMILVNSVGTLPVRASRPFAMYRKIGRHHQNVLVFFKGDVKKIQEQKMTDVFESGVQQTLE